jgi:DNA-binding response OmpR family regulator
MATLKTDGNSHVKHRTTGVERLLLVEADMTLQNTIHEALLSEGYQVEIVSSGPTRLALFRRESLSQEHVSREFMQPVPATAFVLLSTSPSFGDNTFFLETEGDDPPFFAKELVARLGALPRQGHSSLSQSLYVFDNVIVDFVRLEVVRGRMQIPLTRKEFRTLEFLIKNPRRAISRDELLDKVWGYKSYPCTRTVDNHILRLRQKVENDPANPKHLLTVHGLGYRFKP